MSSWQMWRPGSWKGCGGPTRERRPFKECPEESPPSVLKSVTEPHKLTAQQEPPRPNSTLRDLLGPRPKSRKVQRRGR